MVTKSFIAQCVSKMVATLFVSDVVLHAVIVSFKSANTVLIFLSTLFPTYFVLTCEIDHWTYVSEKKKSVEL